MHIAAHGYNYRGWVLINMWFQGDTTEYAWEQERLAIINISKINKLMLSVTVPVSTTDTESPVFPRVPPQTTV